MFAIPALILDEAQALELVSQKPHPGLIGYHGCRVRRGRITGLVLDRHGDGLKQNFKHNMGPIDKERFMFALEVAVEHLHSMGWHTMTSTQVILWSTQPDSLFWLTSGHVVELGRSWGAPVGRRVGLREKCLSTTLLNRGMTSMLSIKLENGWKIQPFNPGDPPAHRHCTGASGGPNLLSRLMEVMMRFKTMMFLFQS